MHRGMVSFNSLRCLIKLTHCIFFFLGGGWGRGEGGREKIAAKSSRFICCCLHLASSLVIAVTVVFVVAAVVRSYKNSDPKLDSVCRPPSWSKYLKLGHKRQRRRRIAYLYRDQIRNLGSLDQIFAECANFQ